MIKTISTRRFFLGLCVSVCVSDMAIATERSDEYSKIIKSLQQASQPYQKEGLSNSKLLRGSVDKGSISVKALELLKPKETQGPKNSQFGGMDGGGGHEDGIEFQKAALEAVDGIKRKMPEVFAVLEQIKFADFVNQVKILVVDDALDVKVKNYIQDSVAVNVPDADTILLNSGRWHAIQSQCLRESIVLHEMLSLKKLESTGYYLVSARYLSECDASSNGRPDGPRVNRLQQIRSEMPNASPVQVFEKLYAEARDPISLEDLARFSGKKGFECAGQVFDFQEKKWSELQAVEFDFLKEDEIRMSVDEIDRKMLGSKSNSSYGPLFPKERHPSFRLNSDNAPFISILDDDQATLVKSDLTFGTFEIKQKTEISKSLDPTVKAHSQEIVRLNSGLLLFQRMYSNVKPTYKFKLVGYCYPQREK